METRIKSYNRVLDKIKKESADPKSPVRAEDIIAVLMLEIAGSLAMIADYMTAKKDGDTE